MVFLHSLRTRRAWRAVALAIGILAWVGPVALALAASVDFGEHDIRSVFRIEKSHNRNQVHYGVRLTQSCVPLTDAPVYVYWRELEKGPNVVLPLLAIEHSAYGIDFQRVQARVVTAGRVLIRLRALPSREVAIESYRDAFRSCQARAVTTIDGQKAILESVFAQVGALSVDWIRLQGHTLYGQQPVREVIRH
jgi:uncharacterized protein DUF4833